MVRDSPRVMFFGLPVLAVVTISEFRAMLAHYYGGDTRMGPWIAVTQQALGRSIHNLSPDSGFFGFMSRRPYFAALGQVFASHPTARQRTERALSHHYDSVPNDEAPAISLLEGTANMELAALQALFPNAKSANLRPLEWNCARQLIYLPTWHKLTTQYRELLAPYRVCDIPDALANLANLTPSVRDPKGMLLTRQQHKQRCIELLWMA